MNVKQVFDKVWHPGLLYKLNKILLHRYYLIMHPYLNNRQFKVRFLDTTTTVFPIEAGVLYDSVLGPILYSIYTTDTLANVATAAFVDDIAVLAADEKPEVASSVLQEHLDKIVKCAMNGILT